MRNPLKPRMNCGEQSWILWDDIQNLIIRVELSRLRRNFFDRINPPEVWRINKINPPASPERERWRAGKIFLYS